MFNRTREAIRERFQNFALQLKYRLGLGTLPALATHVGCFLLGTLLFEPDSRGKIPSETLVPIVANRVKGEIELGREYEAVSASRSCVLSTEAFKLWWPEEKRLFATLGKIRNKGELIEALLKNDTRVVLKSSHRQPRCIKSSSNATIYP
jgi:hypothetical protein